MVIHILFKYGESQNIRRLLQRDAAEIHVAPGAVCAVSITAG